MMNYTYLKKSHPRLYKLLQGEWGRQRETINLTASENYVSEAVLEALGTVFTNKYAEGRPGRRYYFGMRFFDELEVYAQKLALKVFGLSADKWSVNVQSYSGSPANLAVYLALLQLGDTVLAMNLSHGGHLTHGSPVSIAGKFWKFVHYGVGHNGYIDYVEIKRLVKQYRPKLIVCGATSYSRVIDFKKFADIAKSVDAYLLADISHVAGLVVGKVHPSPFLYADVVTTTTHKTLRGPRGAIIFTRKNKLPVAGSKLLISDMIDRVVFPGLQGGPHGNTIFALAVALEEALRPSFKKYAKQTVKNAKVLAAELSAAGFTLVSGGTDNHLMLVDVTRFGWTGQTAGQQLEAAGIVLNKNMLPFDPRKPMDPSGIRLGTPAITTLGMKEKETKSIARFIVDVLRDKKSPAEVKKRVRNFMHKFLPQ